MVCPICKLELENSRKVLGLSKVGIKHFHLQNAHTHNLLHDLVNLVENIAFHHQHLSGVVEIIPFGREAVELDKYAKEISYAENETWEGEDENS